MSTSKKAWLAAGAILLALIGIPAWIWFDAVGKAEAAIERQRTDYEMRLRTLRSAPVRGEGRPGNGWPRLAKALEQIKDLPDSDKEKFPRFSDEEPPPAPVAEELDPILASLQPVLAELEAAVGHAQMEPGYRYEDGASMLIPEVAPALKLSKILADAARLRMEQGRASEAVDLIVLGLRVSRAVSSKGPLVNRLVACVGFGDLFVELRSLLDSDRLTGEELASLAARLESVRPWTADPAGVWEPEWIGTRATLLLVAEHGDKGLGLGGGTAGPRYLFSTRIAVADAFRFLDDYERDAAAAIRAGAAGAEGLAELDRRSEKSPNPLITMLMPAIGRSHRPLLEGEAKVAMARAAVAMRRHRIDRSAWPEKLEDLCPKYLPAVPVDPFSGGPLKLVAKPGEILIYSVGADRDDDSGRPVPESGDGVPDGDVVWTIKGK